MTNYKKHLTQRNAQILFTSIVLISLLQFSFFHVATTFERFTIYWQSAYFAAFGVELSVFVLSLAIGWKNKTGDSTRFFWTVLVMSLIISTVANVSEAWYISDLSLPTWAYSDIGTFIILVLILLVINLLTPFIIVAKSELLGDFVNQIVKEGEKKEKVEAKKEAAQEKFDNNGQDEINRRYEIYKWIYNNQEKNIKSPTMADVREKYSTSVSEQKQDYQWLKDKGLLYKNGTRSYKAKKEGG